MSLTTKLLWKFILLVSILWIAGFIYFISLIPKYTKNIEEKADAIIVLTGGKNRIESGIRLLQQDKAPKLFITGVDTKVRNSSEISKLYHHMNKEYQNRIELGQEAETTYGNAIEAKEWLEKNHIKNIILVTSNYHIPRTMLEFQKMLPEVKIIKYPVLSPKFKIFQWWKYQGTTLLLIKEYNKCLYLIYRNTLNDYT